MSISEPIIECVALKFEDDCISRRHRRRRFDCILLATATRMSTGSSPRLLASLKSIDVHPKVNEDFSQQTSTGGVISATATVLMAVLFVSELRLFKFDHIAVLISRDRRISDRHGQA